jgi:hypothetical protein
MPVTTAAEARRLRAVDVADYERAIGRSWFVCDVPPIFRIRLHCPDPAGEAALLAFLRCDGVYAYAVEGGIEAVAAESPALDAPREMIGRVVDWLAKTDAALSIRIA